MEGKTSKTLIRLSLQVTAKVTGDQGADCHDVADTHWINGHPTPIANPMSGYPQCVFFLPLGQKEKKKKKKRK